MATASSSEESATIPVILDHDGGVDDFVALVILASSHACPETYSTKKRIKLIGVTIVEADTFAEPCVDVCRRALALYTLPSGGKSNLDLASIPVAASDLIGTAAPFPNDWRKDAFSLADFPVLNSNSINSFLKTSCKNYPAHISPHACYADSKTITEDQKFKIQRNGHEVLGDLVVNSPEKVTLVVTGPMTNVAFALKKYGSAFAKNIDRILLMGGAAKVDGNVFNKNVPEYPHKVSGKAEWNIFWDAPAAKAVFECEELSGKIVMFGLDATNAVPVTSQFVRRFGSECQLVTSVSPPMTMPSLLSQFVANAWSQVTFLNRGWGGASYFAWDALTAAFLIDPSVVSESVSAKVTIEARSGHADEGQTIVDFEEKDDAKKNVQVIMKVDSEKFYQIALDSAKMI